MSYASTRIGSAGRPQRPSALKAALSAIVAAVVRPLVLWGNRRAVYRLMYLDDRHLKDIGVSRADIDWALSKPWSVDPSKELADCVARRRAAARWARKHTNRY